MERVTIDATTINKYFGTQKPFEVRDDSGRLIGVFQPVATLQPSIDRAEIERRKRDPEEHTTAEVLQYLERL